MPLGSSKHVAQDAFFHNRTFVLHSGKFLITRVSDYIYSNVLLQLVLGDREALAVENTQITKGECFLLQS